MGDLPPPSSDDPRSPNDSRSPAGGPSPASEADPDEDVNALRAEAADLKTQNLALKAQIDELKAFASAGESEPPKSLQQLHLLQIQPLRDLLVILLIVGVVYLGYLLRPLTIPLLLALALAYLFEPVVRRLTNRGRIGRPVAVISIIVGMFLVVTVPATVGIAYGTVQGVHYGRQLKDHIALLQASVANPTDEELKDRVRALGKPWEVLRDVMFGAELAAQEAARAAEEEAADQGDQDGPEEPAGAETEPEDQAQPETPPATDISQHEEGLMVEGEDDQGEVPPGPVMGQPQVGQPIGVPTSTVQEFARDALAWFNDWIQRAAASFGATYGRQALGTGADVLRTVWRVISRSFYLLFAVFLILFFFFFFSVNYQRVLNSLADLIPKWKRARTLEMVRKMDGVVSGFVRGRLIIMCIQTVMFIIGYWAVGVPAALVVGLIVGVLSLVPYLSLVGIPLTIILMWLQPHPPVWWWVIFAPTVVYFIVQMSDDYVWTPMIQGKTTDMDIPSILFAVLAGGMLAGFYGVLLAIPAAACIKILLKEAFWPRFKAWSEGRVKDFLPISRYDPTSTGIAPVIKKD